MNSKVLLAVFIAYVLAGYAAPSPAKLYADLERHLQSLKTLEVRYEATGSAMPNGAVRGRMVWVKPDRFLHDTPEWTLAETGDEQWRYLKAQNTLILESSSKADRWTPESVLFDLGGSFHPEEVVVQDDGSSTLKLVSTDPNLSGDVMLEFEPETTVPRRLEFRLADGTISEYRIIEWNENRTHEDDLFRAPDVPQENLIDFRLPEGSGR